MPELPSSQPGGSAAVPVDLKWEAEKEFRAREIRIKEREQAAKEQELDLKKQDHALSQWRSPLVVSIIAAAAAAGGNAVVAYLNGSFQRDLERQKSEESRILEMIKTGDPDKAAENLKFLLDAQLISAPETRNNLSAFLSTRKAGSGPTLPSPADAKALVNKLEYGDERGMDAWMEKGYRFADSLGLKTNLGRALMAAELMVGGEPRIRRLVKDTSAAVGGSPLEGADERKWVLEYLNQMSQDQRLPKQYVDRRVREFKQHIDKGDWDLRAAAPAPVPKPAEKPEQPASESSSMAPAAATSAAKSGEQTQRKGASVEARVAKIVAEQLGVEEGKVTAKAGFVKDLGADSLDTVELVMAIEEEFKIEVVDSDCPKLRTPRDIVEYVRRKKPGL